MAILTINADESAYPRTLLANLGERAPVQLHLIGNNGLLQNLSRSVALFSSVKVPGSVILRTYDLAVALRDAHVPVIGGFHSPMERECLAILLRGTQPVIVCLARSLHTMRLPTAWRAPIDEGSLLLISPFPPSVDRQTTESAHKRNLIVAALASRIFVAHASPGGRIERLMDTVKQWHKRVLTFADLTPTQADTNGPAVLPSSLNLSPLLESITGDRVYRKVLLLLGELHQRGYERLRISPGMSASGAYWRCSITHIGNISRHNGVMIAEFYTDAAFYTSGQEDAYFGWEDAAHDTVSRLADKFIERFPEICAKGKGSDPDYASWYRDMLSVTEPNGFPIAYADYDLPDDCLRIIFYDRPDLEKKPDTCIPFPPPGTAPNR